MFFTTPVSGEKLFEKPKDWTQGDSDKLLLTSALMLVDWQQTRTISKEPWNFTETNSFLGEHPTLGQVDTYFLASLPINYLIAKNLPKNWRNIYWQYISITQLKAITVNYQIGVRF
jgi:hypothetical protein